MLESIASEEKYDIPLPSDAGKYGHHTIQTEAIRVLISLGSGIVIESVLDAILEKAAAGLSGGEVTLARMERGVVVKALERRLSSANEIALIRLFELLCIFGDQSVLPIIRTYTNDLRKKIANAAYEAEQRILGLVDLR